MLICLIHKVYFSTAIIWSVTSTGNYSNEVLPKMKICNILTSD